MTAGWDMELDHLQHYFYDDPDEDFFRSTAPSEDIWKKFELVPTPPTSPVRTVDLCGGRSAGVSCGALSPSLGDELEWVSQFLSQEDADQNQESSPPPLLAGSKVGPAGAGGDSSFGGMSSIVLRDCMWNCSAGRPRDRAAGERVPAAADAHCAAAADCVDPAAVLTFPVTNGGGGNKKPHVSSGSEYHSDSSDEEPVCEQEEEEEEEQEEEIDLVTVERRQRPLSSWQHVTIAVRTEPLDPAAVHRQHHNYAAPPPLGPPPQPSPNTPTPHYPSSQTPTSHYPSSQTPTSPNTPTSHYPSSKTPTSPNTPTSHYPSSKTPTSPNTPTSHYPSSKTPTSPKTPTSHYPSSQTPTPHYPSPSSRRRAHNSLERRRRRDLRWRFLSLRDQLPGLARRPRAPKVAILTRAAQHLRELQACGRRLARERRQLRAQRSQLLQRLEHAHTHVGSNTHTHTHM